MLGVLRTLVASAARSTSPVISRRLREAGTSTHSSHQPAVSSKLTSSSSSSSPAAALLPLLLAPVFLAALPLPLPRAATDLPFEPALASGAAAAVVKASSSESDPGLPGRQLRSSRRRRRRRPPRPPQPRCLPGVGRGPLRFPTALVVVIVVVALVALAVGFKQPVQLLLATLAVAAASGSLARESCRLDVAVTTTCPLPPSSSPRP